MPSHSYALHVLNNLLVSLIMIMENLKRVFIQRPFMQGTPMCSVAQLAAEEIVTQSNDECTAAICQEKFTRLQFFREIHGRG